MSESLGYFLLRSCRVWGYFNPKTFQGINILLSGEIDFWVICPQNKFGEKGQCGGGCLILERTWPIFQAYLETILKTLIVKKCSKNETSSSSILAEIAKSKRIRRGLLRWRGRGPIVWDSRIVGDAITAISCKELRVDH